MVLLQAAIGLSLLFLLFVVAGLLVGVPVLVHLSQKHPVYQKASPGEKFFFTCMSIIGSIAVVILLVSLLFSLIDMSYT